MKEQLSALYELQSIDLKIADVQAHLASLDGAKEFKHKLASAKAALESYNKTLLSWEMELRKCELELKTIEGKRANCEKRLYGGKVTNAKELAATEKEIESLKASQEKMDGRILELYDLIEEKKAKIESVIEIEKKIEKKIAIILKREAVDKAEHESELENLQSKRAEAILHITDKHLLSRYDLIRKKTGKTGIAKVIDSQCEGCHVAVMQYTMRQLFEDNELVSCENCGRILMMEVK